MKILITGGAGYIGRYAARAALAAGHEVRIFDSFVASAREGLPERSEVMEGDIRDRAALTDAMRGMTHVIHLAALVSVPESMERPQDYHDVNVTGFLNVLEAARAANIARVAYASSAAVYGDHPELPKRESSPLAPLSPYALSKIFNEQYADLYARAYNLSTIGFRFFNVYGAGQAADHPYSSVIPRWLRVLEEGKTPILYGDGSQTRDFIHAKDVAAALLVGLEAPRVSPVYNIASGTELSLADLHAHLGRIRGAEIPLERRPERAGDIRRSVADITLIRTELGWEPAILFEEGLRDILGA